MALKLGNFHYKYLDDVHTINSIIIIIGHL